MTLQQIFDKAVLATAAQGVPSMRVNYGSNGPPLICAYRSDTGCKCPVGHLIDDEHYSPDFEGSTVTRHWGGLWEALVASGVLITPRSLELLTSLQQAHDLADPDDFPAAFALAASATAQAFHLIMPTLPEAA